jgi:hypothetical protein
VTDRLLPQILRFDTRALTTRQLQKERAKATKYRVQAREAQRMGYNFETFGIESWGAWGPSAIAVLR